MSETLFITLIGAYVPFMLTPPPRRVARSPDSRLTGGVGCTAGWSPSTLRGVQGASHHRAGRRGRPARGPLRTVRAAPKLGLCSDVATPGPAEPSTGPRRT